MYNIKYCKIILHKTYLKKQPEFTVYVKWTLVLSVSANVHRSDILMVIAITLKSILRPLAGRW